jgi:hypothetical protein
VLMTRTFLPRTETYRLAVLERFLCPNRQESPANAGNTEGVPRAGESG